MSVSKSRRFPWASRVGWFLEVVTCGHRRLILCLVLGGFILVGSILALPHSRVSSWLRSRLTAISIAHTSPDDRRPDVAASRAGVNRYRRSNALNSLPEPLLNAPTGLAVPAAANNAITISWTAPAGAVDHYQIERSQSLSGPFTVIANAATTNFNDTTVTSVSSYLYRVRAVDSFGAPSPPSNMALGTAITFLDPNLQAGVTEIKAQHVTELRQAVNAVRSLIPLSAATWTQNNLNQAIIYANDVQELRNGLGAALAALSIPVAAYEDPSLGIAPNGVLVKKVHIEQLRDRATRGSSTSSGPADSGTDSATARLDPMNRTGGGGEDPLSRNFNWSMPLVGLSGRAGLDLGLSLAYNSLATWTKNGSYISFDDDRGSPSPGFRLGFPVIQAVFYNTQASKYSFLMITPSGSRVELRQVGASNLYQSVDSSYLLLDASTMTLRTTDGTQLSYWWMGNDYQCKQIRDRNGNYITVNYDVNGRVDTVIDTLARTIKFNYDSNGLSTITQTWTINGAAQTHTWASFSYANQAIQTNFQGLSVIGPQNGTTIHALTQLTLADGSHLNFDYTSWGQVWKISQYTGETSAHLLNYRSYNLPLTGSTAQADCPRFTQRRDWAENWNRDTNGNAQEVNTSFVEPSSATIPGTSQTGTLTQVTLPDYTYHRIYFGSVSGSPTWQNGLPLLTETYDAGNIKQRWVATSWTQDDTNVAYPLNPRATETNIYDPAGNHARTRVDYATFNLSDGTSCRYPQDIFEYQADATTVLRRTRVEYNMAATYTNLRIIGLPSAKYLCDGAQGEVPCNDQSGASLFAKVAFQYDGSGSIQGSDAPVQHDNTNYGASFVAGRANLSSATRYDVTNSSQFTVSTIQYNTAGAVVATHDPLNHGVTLSYADSFSDGIGRNTLAYPTTVTDPDSYSATAQYNFDFGAVTSKQTPQPNTIANIPGPVQTIAYDSLGRTERVTNLVNNAYTRFVYPPSQNRVDTYATIQDNAGEAHSFKISDGHGRVIASAADHPGSTGGFSGQLVYYDLMGRTVKGSNPTETSASSTSGNPYDWPATGDDAVAGWIYTQQTYDWKGRPLVTTNPSTTGNPADTTTKTTSYGGCGCAGGEVVTLTDETTRRQKVYSDVLGRQWKTEVLNWDSTVYSTTTSSFNARDQVMLVRQYQGAGTSSTYQDTTMTYDGYGRLQSKHVPEQNAGTATTYAYNTDDTITAITDARGASATYGYNGRDLPTSITYSAPAGITPTSTVSFSYDAVGNRASMTDGFGSKSYTYNQLSQLTAEARYISDLGQSLSLNYQYNLAGELISITDPFNAQIGYNHDSIGRVSGVTGAGFANVSTYASNLQYRASGATKHLDYGNSLKLDLSYNNRLLNTQFDLTNSGGSRVAGWQYQYGNDGRLSYSHDLRDDRLDRAYAYNQSAQLVQGISGSEARGNNVYPYTGPYKQTYFFDVWGNLTDRSMRIHGYMGYPSTSYYHDNYVNNRNTGGDSQPWIYDEDGRITNDRTRQYSFDAAGNQTHNSQNSIYRSFDGDGEVLKKIESGAVTYYLQSSVVGEVINELNQYGQKQRGYVYRDGEILAKQEGGQVLWNHDEPSGTSSQWSTSSGATSNRVETDPLGTQVDENGGFSGGGFSSNPIGFYGDTNNMGGGCAAGSAGMACTGVLNYRGGLAWQSMLTFGFPQTTIETRIGTKQVFNPRWETIFDMRKTVKYEYTQAVTTYVFLGAFFRSNWLPPSGPIAPDPPQKPAAGSFLDCFGKAGLKGTLFNSDAADLIKKITGKEPISPELLAVTWMNEHSDFLLRPNPNTNDHPEDINQWDVGPFGLNVGWTMAQVHAQEVSDEGLELPNYLGYNYYRSDMKTPAPFSGDPVENGQMAARRLNFWGGSDENKAVKHTKKTSQAQRRKSFRQYAPLFRKFFACYRK